MESLVLSILSKYLNDYVNNFRREQVSMNFLRGQGVIRDIDINVDAINEYVFALGAPSLKFSRILINTLSIEAPFMSLKSKPITVYIDEMFVEIIETPEPTKYSTSSTAEGGDETASKTGSSYGYMDRIIDSISFEINRLLVAYATLGKLKAKKMGPWTPPVMLAEFCGNRFYCTNHQNNETELEECFRIMNTNRPILFIYKQLKSRQASLHMINPKLWPAMASDLIAGNSLHDVFKHVGKTSGDLGGRDWVQHRLLNRMSLLINMCFRKRMDNAMLLGLEISLIIETVKVSLRQAVYSQLLQFFSGLFYSIDTMDPPDKKKKKKAMAEKYKARDYEGFGREEIARLRALEQELGTAAASVEVDGKLAVGQDNSGWQRSTLNSDTDPPHLRLVVSVEVREITLSMPYDELLVPTNGSEESGGGAEKIKKTPTSSSKGKARAKAKCIEGVQLSVLNLVYCSIWPEHAGSEGVQQVSCSRFAVHAYEGVRKTSLLRTTRLLDENGRPLVTELLPRGVKEHGLVDPESREGISFVFRMETCWPPPPLHKGVSSNTEICLSPLEVQLILPSLDKLVTYFVGANDPRWESCEWNDPAAIGWRVNRIKTGGTWNAQIIFDGLDVMYSPLSIDRNDPLKQSRTPHGSRYPTAHGGVSKGMHGLATGIATGMQALDRQLSRGEENEPAFLLPPLYSFHVALASLIWKSTIEVSHIKSFIPAHQSDGNGDSFPFEPSDVSEAFRNSKPIHGVDLISLRFEANIAGIRLCVADTAARTNTPEWPPKEDDISRTKFFSTSPVTGYPMRDLLRPFSANFLSTIDPHPNPPPGRHYTPQMDITKDCSLHRPYYWEAGDGVSNYCTIQTMFVAIEDFNADLSLLDIVHLIRLSHVLNDDMRQCNIFDLSDTSSDSGDGGLNEQMKGANQACEEERPHATQDDRAEDTGAKADLAPFSLFIVTVRNMSLSIVPVKRTMMALEGEKRDSSADTNALIVPDDENSSPRGCVPESIIDARISDGLIVLEYAPMDSKDPLLARKKAPDDEKPTSMVLKGVLDDFTLSMNDTPAIIFSCGEMHELKRRVHTANSSSYASSVSLRYQSRPPVSVDKGKTPITDTEVIVRFLPNCKLLINPEPLPQCATWFIHELVYGFGSVETSVSHWWEDSVFGYLRYRIEKLLGISSRSTQLTQSNNPVDDNASTWNRESLEAGFKSGPKEATTIKVTCTGLQLALFSTEPLNQMTRGEVPSHFDTHILEFDLSNLDLELHWQPITAYVATKRFELSVRVYAVTEVAVESFNKNDTAYERRMLCDNAVVKIKWFKTDTDTNEGRSRGDLSVSDILSGISAADSKVVRKAIIAPKNAVTEFMAKIQQFWDTIEDSTFPMITSSASLRDSATDESKIGSDKPSNGAANGHITEPRKSFAGLQGVYEVLGELVDPSLNQSCKKTSTPLSALSPSESIVAVADETDVTSKANAAGAVSMHMAATVLDAQVNLKSTHIALQNAVLEIETFTESLAEVAKVMRSQLDRVRASSLASLWRSSVYCGWMRKTAGFSKVNAKPSSTRWWTVLTSNMLLFMSQPYSQKVEYEVDLSEGLLVVDPDADESAAVANAIMSVDMSNGASYPAVTRGKGKKAITSSLWLVNDQGLLAIDPESLDEKVVWAESLKPWFMTTSYRPAATSGASDKSSTASDDKDTNPQRRGLLRTISSAVKGSGHNHPRTPDVKARGHDSDPIRHTANRLKSATKGVMKVLTMSGVREKAERASALYAVPHPNGGTTGDSANMSRKGSSRQLSRVGSSQSESSLSSQPTTIPVDQYIPPEKSIDNFTGMHIDTASGSFHGTPDRTSGVLSNDHLLSSRRSNQEWDGNAANGGSGKMGCSKSHGEAFVEDREVERETAEVRHLLDECDAIIDNVRCNTSLALESAITNTKMLLKPLGYCVVEATALRMHAEEVTADSAALKKAAEERHHELATALYGEREKILGLQHHLASARRHISELEATLLAITTQHTATMHQMSQRFFDLQEQFNVLKGTDSFYSSLGPSDSDNVNEMVRHLTISVNEMEQMLKEAEEKEVMLQEEM
jgi:hypothetical protein